MWSVLVWWLAIEVIGLLALPLTLVLFRFLPDRGLGMARPVGLLLSAYAYWLLVSLGLLRNSRAAIVVVLLGLGGCSLMVWRRHAESLGAFVRRHRRTWLVTAVVFLLCLAGFAAFRAYNPDIAATEKPMEFAFLNGILRSETFPPQDPWMSGYGISYYYFGYVMVAMVTRLTGLPSAVASNLAGATLFAMAFTGAFSLVANMVEAHRAHDRAAGGTGERSLSGVSVGTGLFGGVIVALMGNLEGVFELVRARGWGTDSLWRFLDVRNLQATPPSTTWYPDDMWWWWRASRVIHDRDLLGNSMEVIDEFPFFSFLLGDNHPHVLALPFLLLGLALALNVLCRPAEKACANVAAGGSTSLWERMTFGVWRGWSWDIPLWAVLLGALGFLNTWDYPTTLGMFVLAYLAWRLRTRPGHLWADLLDAVTLGVMLGVLGLLFYLPFYLGFRSQAGGIGLVFGIKTQWQQYGLMFGTQIVLAAGLLAAVAGGRLSVGARGPSLLSIIVGSLTLLIAVAFAALGWWTAMAGLLLAGVAVSLLLWRVSSGRHGSSSADAGAGLALSGTRTRNLSAGETLALLALVAGLLLSVVVEFIYLRDTFNTRMNTVFKFYYQAWVLLSVAGAFGVYRVLGGWRSRGVFGRLWRGVWIVAVGGLVVAGLSYTVMATASKANAFRGTPTLDGAAYRRVYNPEEYEAVTWLKEHAEPDAVMVEASGNSYSDYNWVSAHTGIPTLLGWGGHELQWRGNYDEAGQREADIAVIYQPGDVAATADILARYDVDYVYVGPKERTEYGVNDITIRKLGQIMQPVFENDQVTIFGYK